MLNTSKYILLLILAIISAPVVAQRDTTLTQEVEVFKSFKPTISDANKINDMPKADQTEHQKPTFNYRIISRPIFNTFSVNSLKAAAIAESRKPDTGYGLVRAGLGNYNKPYGEFFFDHLNSKKSIFGIHGKHLSSLSKIKLEGGDRVDAPFAKNEAEIFFNQFFRKSILSLNFDLNHDGFDYYGYPKEKIPTFLTDKNQDLNYQGKRQTFTRAGVDISLSNPSLEMDDNDFSFNLRYYYFVTKTQQKEHYGKFSARVQHELDKGVGILEAGAIYSQVDGIYNRATYSIGQRNQVWLFANPTYIIGDKTANLHIGAKTWFLLDKDFDAVAHVAPNIRGNYSPIDALKLYGGVTGDFTHNSYSKIAYENPFVDPEHDVKNSFEKIHFFGGIDGKFSPKTNFKISANYSITDHQPLYYLHQYTHTDPNVNPNPVVTDNDFKVLYDNINLFKFNLEIFHTSSEKLEFLLSGNYYLYDLNEQKSAWNLPDWDANFSLSYNITQQLSISTDVFLIGTRKALIMQTLFRNSTIDSVNPPILKSYNLDTAIDLNVRGEYKITEKLSVFAQLNNFGFQKYERWLGYPVQSFNFLGGLSYAF
ncbi:MAG: hypothetical protein JXR61_14320 [Prolixibacteraceae bacterium]|nr:hypothetical protein [Prolixibacteraceae bacterium]